VRPERSVRALLPPLVKVLDGLLRSSPRRDQIVKYLDHRAAAIAP
jgi:hypothetical protein